MRRFLAAVVAALSLTALLSSPLLSSPSHASTQRTTAAVFPAEIIGEDFPDPDVFEQKGTWYAYSTNNGRGTVPGASAPSANGPWTIRGDAMPGGPASSWAQPGRTWAPDVYPNGDGTYTLT